MWKKKEKELKIVDNFMETAFSRHNEYINSETGSMYKNCTGLKHRGYSYRVLTVDYLQLIASGKGKI